VPDSTYENVGGLDKQIKEIKEVIELPVKHPELFDALGIAQPKVCALLALSLVSAVKILNVYDWIVFLSAKMSAFSTKQAYRC